MARDNQTTALILEDELSIVLDIEEVLLSLGFSEIVSFSTVSEAIAWLEGNEPAVAIIDLRLKTMTSEVVAAKLKASNTPTIVYSGNDFTPGVDHEVFADLEWVSKPASSCALHVAIHRAARSSPADCQAPRHSP